jgi:hypothetical protein
LGRELRDDEITVVPGNEGPANGVPDQQTTAIHPAAPTEGISTGPFRLEGPLADRRLELAWTYDSSSLQN